MPGKIVSIKYTFDSDLKFLTQTTRLVRFTCSVTCYFLITEACTHHQPCRVINECRLILYHRSGRCSFLFHCRFDHLHLRTGRQGFDCLLDEGHPFVHSCRQCLLLLQRSVSQSACSNEVVFRFDFVDVHTIPASSRILRTAFSWYCSSSWFRLTIS